MSDRFLAAVNAVPARNFLGRALADMSDSAQKLVSPEATN
jgi:hypothetical protein